MRGTCAPFRNSVTEEIAESVTRYSGGLRPPHTARELLRHFDTGPERVETTLFPPQLDNRWDGHNLSSYVVMEPMKGSVTFTGASLNQVLTGNNLSTSN